MKIVVNRGFYKDSHLPLELMVEYFKTKYNTECLIFDLEENRLGYEDEMFNDLIIGLELEPDMLKVEYNNKIYFYIDKYSFFKYVNRTDELLIKLVEEYDTSYESIEIPDDVDWVIQVEDDSYYEYIAERYRVW